MNRTIYIQVKSMLIVAMIAGMFMSCNTEESCADLGTCPETVLIERTDIIIDGELSITDHQVFEVTGIKEGPVDYNFYGNPSETFDFLIELSSGHTLVITMHNEGSLNPWNDVNVPYNTYPAQMLEDKSSYVTAHLITGSETASYSTNLGDSYPQIAGLDVFRVTSNDGEVIRCRIRDMELFKNTDSDQTIHVNGTFTAVIVFDSELSESSI